MSEPIPRPRLILAICCLSMLLVGMDITIVNVALPSIADAFHGGVADLQWVIDAYTVVLARLLIFSRLDGRPAGPQANRSRPA